MPDFSVKRVQMNNLLTGRKRVRMGAEDA